MTTSRNRQRIEGWHRAGVYGLGLSGWAALELLRSRGVEVVAFDRRQTEQVDLGDHAEDQGIQWFLGGEPTSLPEPLAWRDLDALVVSPGVPMDRPLLAQAKAAGVPVIAEVELVFPLLDGEVIGITGSNGKSTTTELTGAMLRAAGWDARVCGNIGEPLSHQVEMSAADLAKEPAKKPAKKLFVVELSSFQLEAVDEFRPHSAALLNLSHDHLDRHEDLAAYRDAKLTIFSRQSTGDLAVLNADDPEVAKVAPGLAARSRFFSRLSPVLDGCYLEGDVVVETAPGQAAPKALFATAEVPLPGPHNLENAMAAALLSRAHGALPADIVRGMKTFQGLPHRLQEVRRREGVIWYDDSKGTNLAATAKSLQGFEDSQVVAILGGRFKGGDLTELARVVARKARHSLLIGESAEQFASALAAAGASYEHVGELSRAVARAAESSQAGEIVLLSPACSSFDQFANFAERGRVFQSLVHQLEGEDGS